ncbi:hypothetical protein IFR04_015829 [Cadophora malorum]|uniref:Uncharacterized protein n=1 Tax=Cadophora malorum TaxID=108018 RepID=A0A8H7T260_9HELO|nr:hypothetical protein IFR04_015829 [Cadophora malorum]
MSMRLPKELGEDEKRKGFEVGQGRVEDTQPSLRLLESTFKHERKKSTPIASPKRLAFVNISGPRSLAMPNLFDPAMKSQPEKYMDRLEDAHMRETPEFKRYEDATNIEIFYDLFHDRSLDTSHLSSLRDLAPPLLRLAQAWLSFGSCLLKSAYPS